MKKILSFLFLMALSLQISFAQKQETGVIKGRVVNEDQVPIAQSLIIANIPNTNEPYVVDADAQGRYTLPYEAEVLIINVTAIGYQTETIEIKMRDYLHKELVTVLKPLQYILDEVEVVGKIPTIKRENGKFVMKDISSHPFSKGTTVLNFLKVIPMLNVDASGSIRILNKSKSTILINGRNSGFTDASDLLKTIPADRIERIEIIPVTGSEFSATSKSGIVNFILKKRADEGLKGVLSIDDTQRHYNSPSGSLFLNYSKDKIRLTFGVRGSYYQLFYKNEGQYDYFDTLMSNQTSSYSDGASRSISEYLNMDYHINKKQVVGFRVSGGQSSHKDHDYSYSTFYPLASTQVDSMKLSKRLQKTPTVDYHWSTNINYNLKTDDEGSQLRADLNYYQSRNNLNFINLHTSVFPDNSTVVENDFMQDKKTFNKVAHFNVKYRKVISDDAVFNTGVSLMGGKIKNNYFYGVHDGANYISDANYTNDFNFKDFTLGAFVNYEKTWSDKFQTDVGLRYEYYNASGNQLTTGEKTKRIDKNFFPSIAMTYEFNDNHELALDMSSSYFIPGYSMLNPFIVWNSATMYTRNNPNLKSSKGYEAMLTYSFFNDHILSVDYSYDKDLFTEFTMAAPNNLIQNTTLNYGHGHTLDIYLMSTIKLFNSKWRMSPMVMASYNSDSGQVEGQDMSYTDWSYAFQLANNIILYPKYNWTAHVKYSFDPNILGASANRKSIHDLDISSSIMFKDFYISFGTSGILGQNIKLDKTYSDFRYFRKQKKYRLWYMSISYTFGNKKVRQVYNRDTSDIERRM